MAATANRSGCVSDVASCTQISTDLGRKLPDYPLQSLLNSILFLGLFVDIRPDTLLKKVVMNWSSHIEAFRKDAYVAGYPEVVSILTAKLCEDKDALDGLVSNVHIMHSREVHPETGARAAVIER